MNFRLIYDFDPPDVSAALCFVWEMERDELQIKQQPHLPALFPEMAITSLGRTEPASYTHCWICHAQMKPS
jgi:hypothetical protein